MGWEAMVTPSTEQVPHYCSPPNRDGQLWIGALPGSVWRCSICERNWFLQGDRSWEPISPADAARLVFIIRGNTKEI